MVSPTWSNTFMVRELGIRKKNKNNQLIPQKQLQLPSNASTSNPPLHLQLLIQSNLNLSNRGTQKVETLNLPTYNISITKCSELNLPSSWVVNAKTSPIIVEHTNDEALEPEHRNSSRRIVGDLT